MSKLDKDQLDKISGGVVQEKTENFREGDNTGDRSVGVYWDGGDEKNSEISDSGGSSSSIGPNNR